MDMIYLLQFLFWWRPTNNK